MSCIRFTPQNEEVASDLFDQLYNIVGQDEFEADELYSFFRTPEFIDMFGDYIIPLAVALDDDSLAERIDENGEPKLFEDRVLNKTYFKDINNERVYYPFSQGLVMHFDIADIKALRESMALKYYSNLTIDFDTKSYLNTEDVKLRTIITEFLDAKSEEMRGSSDIMTQQLGESLNDSKEFINEWIQEVKDFYESKGLKIKKNQIEEEEKQEDLIKSTAPRTQIARPEAFLVDKKASVNANIKLYLSLLTGDKVNAFDEVGFIPFDDVYTTLNIILSNTLPTEIGGNLTNIYDIFLQKIKEHAQFKPYLKQLYDKIQLEDNDNFKYQFINTFYLARKKFLNSDIIIDKGKYTYDIKDVSEVSSRKKGIISEWGVNFTKLSTKLKDIHAVVGGMAAAVKKVQSNPNELALEITVDKLMKDMHKLGITSTKDGLNYLIAITGGTSLEEKIEGLDEIVTNMAHALKNFKSDSVSDILTNSAFVKFAAAESFFQIEGSDASFFSVGKTRWLYSLYSHLEKTVLDWGNDPSKLANHISSSAYTKGSFYAKYFLAEDVAEEDREVESKRRIKEIEAFVFNSVQIKNESIDAVDNKNIFHVDAVADYINKMFNYLKPNGKIYHKTALAADKSTEYQMSWGRDASVFMLDANAVENEDGFKLNSDVIEVFFDYFKSDYYRMTEVHDALDAHSEDSSVPLKVHYHTGRANGKVSQLFPSLSPTFDDKGVATNPRGIGEVLYDETGRPIYDNLDEDNLRAAILPVIKKALLENIRQTVKTLESNNISYYTMTGFRKFQGIDEAILDKYIGAARKYKKNLTEEQRTKRKARVEKGFFALAADLTVNSLVSQVEYSKLITGDVAYYKNPIDYKKRVPATYTDGQYLALLNSDDKHFNAAVINAVEFSTPNLKLLKKKLPARIWKQYEEVNAADAQAWITPERWMFIMERVGKGVEAKPIFEKMYEEKPIFTTSELKLLAQPLKGVYFSNKEGHPVFLKYSQGVLLPRLVKNTPLEKLYNQMVKQSVDELITIDGMKVGAVSPVTTHNEQGDILDNVEFNVMELDNANWKLQQDLPTKGIKPRELGSQIQKNIFQGLVYNPSVEFDVAGNPTSGVELITLINDLFGALSMKGMDKFFKQLGITNADHIINNEDGLYANLTAQAKSRTNTNKNTLNALQSRTSPFGIPSTYSTFQNIFSSLANSSSVKIKTNGGGYIQMADYGLSKSEAKKQGMRFTPWFDKNAERLSPPVIGKHPVTGKDIIKPGGIFLSGSMIAKHIPNYARLSDDLLFGKYNPETGRYEGGKIDDRLLRNIIGYRIPNQALSSNDALEVMGILPEETGDTVIAYTGITEKTGSDFDIDKMYLMVPSFNAVYSSEKDTNPYRAAFNFIEDMEWSQEKINSEIYQLDEVPTGNPDADKSIIGQAIMEDMTYEYFDEFRAYKEIKSARRLEYAEFDESLPLEQQSESALQNRLIEAYKAVLLHPETYAQVMNPIEVAHVKNDIKNLLPEEVEYDLQHFSGVRDLQLKSNFRLGKSGLGQVINFLVDAVRGSMGRLQYKGDGFSWGNSGLSGTILDERYSEEMSEEEILSYIDSYNSNLKEGDTPMTIEKMQDLKKLEATETFMGLVNGFVDIANDEYIVRGNWTSSTLALGLTLIRAGVHPFKVNAFLMQPVIKEFTKFSDIINSKNSTTKGNIEHLFKLDKMYKSFPQGEEVEVNGIVYNMQELIKKVVPYNVVKKIKFNNKRNFDRTVATAFRGVKKNLYSKFDIDVESEDVEDLDNLLLDIKESFNTYFASNPVVLGELSMSELRDQANNPVESTQIGMFEIYLEWSKKSAKLSKIVKANKSDTDGKGKNITSNVITLNLINQVMNANEKGDILGYKTLLNYNDSPTLLNHAIINGVSTPFKIMQANNKFFPSASKGAVRTFNFIARMLGEDNLLDQGLGDRLEKSYYSYILSGFTPLQMDNKEKAELINTMVKDFRDMKKAYPDNVLLKELSEVPSDAKGHYFLAMSTSKKNTSRSEAITDAWSDLMELEPEFAEKLVKYSYIESSFGNSITQFHEFIPYQWFNKNRINSYLKDLDVDMYNVDFNFVDQFFRNNLETLDDFSSDLESWNSGLHNTDFTGKYLRVGTALTEKTQENLKYIGILKPRVNPAAAIYADFANRNAPKPKTEYFKVVGMTKFKQPIYLRISPLGMKDEAGNKFFEYNINTIDNPAGLRSLFLPNVKNYLTSKGLNVDTLDAHANRITNYNLPRFFYRNLDTLPIEIEEIASAKPKVKKIVKKIEPIINSELEENQIVFNENGEEFVYKGIREEGLGKGGLRLENPNGDIVIAGENTKLYSTSPKELNKEEEGFDFC